MANTVPKTDGFIAFISYSHQDGRWAKWLHHQIETYVLPKPLIGQVGRRKVGRVFLDRSELSTSTNLSTKIEEALASSANLLLICSPAARRSKWVNEEVRRFRAAGKGDRIFCLIVDGDPASDTADGCFPPALFDPVSADEARIEPLAADIRPGKDRAADAKLKLLAGLLDVPFDAIKRREQARQQRFLLITAAVSFTLLAVMTVLAVLAVLSRREAVRQRDTAQRTASFLGDLFDEARPERTGGKEITVRSMIDRAASSAVASPELRKEPEVRAQLLSTLADVYAKLHLPAAGRALASEANRFPIADKQTILYRDTVAANLLMLSSDDAALGRVLDNAFATIGEDAALRARFAPQLLIFRAQLAQNAHKPEEAERDFQSARKLSLEGGALLSNLAVTALLAAAVADVDNGLIDRGEARLQQIIKERRALGEPTHPDILTATNSLGGIAFKRGDIVAAEAWFRRAIKLQRQVFGEASLDVALSRSNLGRALVEQRRFAEAKENLLAARSVYLKEVGKGADALANLEDSLGLSLMGLNQPADAEMAFDRGLAVARANTMPKEIELLTDLADLQCATGRTTEGMASINAARRVAAAFSLPEPWRAARIDNVAGGCLLKTADGQKEAARLIRQSTAVVIARWGKDSLFGKAARERLSLLER